MVEFVKWVFHLRLAIGSCSSRLSVCSDESVDALNVEDSSEHKTDPVVGRTTMCKSVKHFENSTKGNCVEGVWLNS